ncbi:MAG TPA: DJ-1/PfpI family protein [Candidatus Angelobacter sp.]|nr:DJ-1/PfpI family protein [Candidatus Angelobacter sp.]
MPQEKSPIAPTLIGIPLYPSFDSLDVAGPHQTFYMQEPSLKPLIIGSNTCDPVVSFEGMKIVPDCDFESCPQLDVLFVPGGVGLDKVLLEDKRHGFPYLHFLERQAAKARLVTSVCTGAIFMAAAGLLDGYRATTHWDYLSVLKLFPKVIVAEGYPRFVIDANRVTGGGISSGLDEAMAIVSLLLGNHAAKRGQLTMQYAPQPPFNDGDPSTAEPSILYQVSSNFRQSVEDLSKVVEKVQASFSPKGSPSIRK